MPTLYGLCATHPSRPPCVLRDDQNARIADGSIDGWGLGVVKRSTPLTRKQSTPAEKSARYREDAFATSGTLFLTQISTAAGFAASPDTVPPFLHRKSMLIAAGHIPAFPEFRDDLLGALPPSLRESLEPGTWGAHLHHLLLERQRQVPTRSHTGSVRAVLQNLRQWSRAVDPAAEISLAILWAVDERLIGLCAGVDLFALQRAAPFLCPGCGRAHAAPPSDDTYRAVSIADAPATDEDWERLPDRSLFTVDKGATLTVRSLDEVHSGSWLQSQL